MKTRNLVLALAAAAAVPVFAFTGENVCGLVRIDSCSKSTVIGVPWVEVGGGDVAVSNLVSTANLTKGDSATGDQLRYYYVDGSGNDTWYSWYLSSVTGAWTPMTTAKESSNDPWPAPPAGYTITRGKALVLVRQNPYTVDGTTTNSVPFYLYGQYTNATVAAQTIPRDASKQVYTLLASPYAAEYDLNGKITGASANDLVIFYDSETGAQKFYRYMDDAWKHQEVTTNEVTRTRGGKTQTIIQTTTTWVAEGTTVPAGQGFWYVTEAGTGNNVNVAW